jgi:hypothetical protein
MSITYVSQSMYGQFNRCPQQFMRRWINGEITPPGIAARRGSSVHKAAEVNHVQKLLSSVDLPVEQLQEEARDEYVRLVTERGVFIPRDQVGEKNKLLAQGLDDATRLAKVYAEELAPQIQPIWAERRVFLDAGLEVPLAGTIDVLAVGHILRDMKTSAKTQPQAFADNSIQLTWYAGLVAQESGIWPFRILMDVLITKKVAELETLVTNRAPQDFANLIERVGIMLAQVETGLFPPCQPDNWMCSPKWCGYWYSCKWGGQK